MMGVSRSAAGGLCVLAGLLLAACSEPAPPVRQLEVSGRVLSPPGASGPVSVSVYHAWALTGELRHPLEFIADIPVTDGQFAATVDYPLDMGTGLAVYAWQDLDGDGVLCTPTVRDDLAGLSVLETLPDGPVNLDVSLTAACRGPDFFYPPAP